VLSQRKVIHIRTATYPIVEVDNDQWLVGIGHESWAIEAPRRPRHKAASVDPDEHRKLGVRRDILGAEDIEVQTCLVLGIGYHRCILDAGETIGSSVPGTGKGCWWSNRCKAKVTHWLSCVVDIEPSVDCCWERSFGQVFTDSGTKKAAITGQSDRRSASSTGENRKGCEIALSNAAETHNVKMNE
jgi:hypothetical protein